MAEETKKRKKLFSEIPYIDGGDVILRRLAQEDAPALKEMVDSPKVYRYLPTFLFEKKYDDIHYVIDHLYDECFEESIILGIFVSEDILSGDKPVSEMPACEKPACEKSACEKTAAGSDAEGKGARCESYVFCGLAEMYGFRDDAHKISIGLRTTERSWGKEIGVKVIGMMVDYLYGETDIEIITASTMIDNRAVAKMVAKTDLELVVHDSPEDWGYEEPTRTDKWIV